MTYFVVKCMSNKNIAVRESEWGPFYSRPEAERCVTALAVRSDVCAAWITEEPGNLLRHEDE